MEMEASCVEKLAGISNDFNVSMGFIMSHWEDTDGLTGLPKGASFVGCQASKSAVFSSFTTNQMGSTENSDGSSDTGARVQRHASNISMCGDDLCTECMESFYQN